jgi:hypothetical protein
MISCDHTYKEPVYSFCISITFWFLVTTQGTCIFNLHFHNLLVPFWSGAKVARQSVLLLLKTSFLIRRPLDSAGIHSSFDFLVPESVGNIIA